jgi:hypothetical protein
MRRERGLKKRKLELEREELQLKRHDLEFKEEELEIARAWEQLEVRGDDDEVIFVSEIHVQNSGKFDRGHPNLDAREEVITTTNVDYKSNYRANLPTVARDRVPSILALGLFLPVSDFTQPENGVPTNPLPLPYTGCHQTSPSPFFRQKA